MENKHIQAFEKQSLKDKLTAIILLESSKPYKEMDSVLVKECVDFLMELEGKQKLTKSEIEQRVSEIPFKGKITAIGSYAGKKMRAKRLAVIAAVLAVIVALFGIIAIASGSTSFELLREVGKTIHEWFEGGSMDYEDITFIKPNETKTYSSIEELAESEGIDILYPAWLPENEKIVKVWYLIEGETERYVLQSENPLHSIEVKADTEFSEDFKFNCKEKKFSEYLVYYEETPQYVQSNFIYKNNVYIVKSDTEDNLFRIIENLKEIN